ncbi:AAA family ATPase [Tabrizicola sp.]|uniref:AAA family ATPase n=1 Tax=Tabrizicola sp. TaxID=2005166 RepID=UPI003F30E800
MQRVMIVGQPGSGKSTLARELGQRTGLPVFHMDHIHWQAGWVERPRAEKIRLALEVEAQERWIFEGGLSATYDNRVARADTLIWLDLPVGLRFWRVVKRSVRYFGQTRSDLPDGCAERLGPETLPFWRYIWRTRATARQRILLLLASAPPHLTIVHLRRRREVARFLNGLMLR